MSFGRIFAACCAAGAVAGCAAVALGMGHAQDRGPREGGPPSPLASQARLVRPAALPMSRAAGAVAASSAASSSSAPASSSSARPSPSVSASVSSSSSPSSSSPSRSGAASRPAGQRTTAPAAATVAATTAAVLRGGPLPLRYRTGTATKVITVTAASTRSTTAVVQAWTKAPGGGWLKHGRSVTAHVGADGLSSQPSESRSATPIGSFTLTQAFGYDANPGTSLPYLHTRPSDWWISQAGPLYNTHQRCASSCPFRLGDPNEHLYYETPYYNYAVVIDYNTRNSPTGVVQGAGSAFFLHVYPPGTGPTAGCVAIPQWKLIDLLRWLTPTSHPRIVIGVA